MRNLLMRLTPGGSLSDALKAFALAGVVIAILFILLLIATVAFLLHLRHHGGWWVF